MNLDPLRKLSNLYHISFSAVTTWHQSMAATLAMFLGVAALHTMLKRSTHSILDVVRVQLLIGLLSSSMIAALSPFYSEAHYLLVPLVYMLGLFCVFPKLPQVVTALLLLALWLSSPHLAVFTNPPPRTIAQLNKCFADFCALERTPLFVSGVSSIHRFHTGVEFSFAMKKHGCAVRDIVTDSTDQTVHRMVVVGDQRAFVPHQDDFHELTLFGTFTPTQTYACPGSLTLQMIER